MTSSVLEHHLQLPNLAIFCIWKNYQIALELGEQMV